MIDLGIVALGLVMYKFLGDGNKPAQAPPAPGQPQRPAQPQPARIFPLDPQLPPELEAAVWNCYAAGSEGDCRQFGIELQQAFPIAANALFARAYTHSMMAKGRAAKPPQAAAPAPAPQAPAPSPAEVAKAETEAAIKHARNGTQGPLPDFKPPAPAEQVARG